MDGWNTSFLLGWPIFRCYVSFREGKTNMIKYVSNRESTPQAFLWGWKPPKKHGRKIHNDQLGMTLQTHRASDESQKPTLLLYRKKMLVFPRQSDLGAKRDGTKTYHVNIHESYSIRLSNYFLFTTQILPGRQQLAQSPQDWFKKAGVHTFSCFLAFQHLGRAVLKPANPNDWAFGGLVDPPILE